MLNIIRNLLLKIVDNIDSKIIESAIIYWFLDEDYVEQHKVLKYFKTM